MFVISKIFYVNVISRDKHNQELKFSPTHNHSDFRDILIHHLLCRLDSLYQFKGVMFVFEGKRRRRKFGLGKSVPVYKPQDPNPIKLHFTKGMAQSPYMVVQKLPVIKVHILNHGQ